MAASAFVGGDSPVGSPAADRVAAVVVTYNPDLDRLGALLDATIPQVHRVYVVDNGSAGAVRACVAAFAGVAFIALGRNLGLAAAQNVGARAGIEAGAEFLLLLDQDSVPAGDMLARLFEGYRAMTGMSQRVAAVGPGVVGRSGPTPFATYDWFKYGHAKPRPELPWTPCDLLIASGMLIPVDVWRRVGPMDESLFIDKVDIDWCLRATWLGYVFGGAPEAVLDHRLGERTILAWTRKGWRQVEVHHPFRYYYMFRNGILMLGRPHASWRWRTAEVRSSFHVLVLFLIFSGTRWPMMRMMLRGVVDGLRRKTGPLDFG
ncbi:MAG: glycosyltransferase family 2 protein [Thiobacillus sp.]